jgi:hypothetical protein
MLTTPTPGRKAVTVGLSLRNHRLGDLTFWLLVTTPTYTKTTVGSTS